MSDTPWFCLPSSCNLRSKKTAGAAIFLPWCQPSCCWRVWYHWHLCVFGGRCWIFFLSSKKKKKSIQWSSANLSVDSGTIRCFNGEISGHPSHIPYFNLKLPKAGSPSALTLQFYNDSFSKHPRLLLSSLHISGFGRIFLLSINVSQPKLLYGVRSCTSKCQWLSSTGTFRKNRLLDAKVQLRELSTSNS